MVTILRTFQPMFCVGSNLPSCQRNPPTGLAGVMVQTYRQTDKFCIFSDMPPGIKPSQDGGEKSIIKREVAKIPFLAFSHYHGTIFAKFLAHVLSWVKTYHHAELQRNPPTGLARMMVQTYRQILYFP